MPVGQPFLAARRAILECGGLAAAFSVEAVPRRIRRAQSIGFRRTAISWPAIPAARPHLVHSFALSHPIAAVGTSPVAHARSNRFSLGVVLYETLFDAPAGRVTHETGLLPVGRQTTNLGLSLRARFIDASGAPPCCESAPRFYQSTPKRREGQRTGSLFSMRRQARSGHRLVANGRTGHHLNVGF
jgi:hypothetical protein